MESMALVYEQGQRPPAAQTMKALKAEASLNYWLNWLKLWGIKIFKWANFQVIFHPNESRVPTAILRIHSCMSMLHYEPPLQIKMCN